MRFDYVHADGSTSSFDTLTGRRLATDQKTIAERKWQAPSKAPAEQKPCDVGLFSDDAKQPDLPF